MSSLKSKTTPHPTKNPSLCWMDLEIQHIVAWLGYRDELGELSNFDLYQTGNKLTAAKKLLYDTRIAETKSGVTKEKARDKLGTMIKLYKDWRDKAETTGWGIDPANHHYTANELIGPQTIQEVLISKCPWYYEFGAIMGRSPNVAPLFFMKSENPDRETLSPQDNIYQDIDTQEYQNWICSRLSQPIDPKLKQIDEENLEENGSDEAYYDEPNHNTRD